MAKRRLSKQQQQRIADRHKQRLAVGDLPADDAPEFAGQVCAVLGADCVVQDNELNKVTCSKLQNLPDIVVGDWVIWQAINEDQGRIIAIKDRSSELYKIDRRSNKQLLAANISQVCVVLALQPEISLLDLDKYLVAAQLLNLQVLIVINKIDLLSDPKQVAFKQLYQDLGYNIIECSVTKDNNLQDLSAAIKQHSNIFIGQSGVGKSSIIQYLLPDEAIKIGAIQEQHKVGKHTTTTAQLYNLDEHSQVIDAPGIREFTLWPVTLEDLNQGFKEFAELANQCKFRNCSHQNEPNCAVLAALEAGTIAQSRYQHFSQLLTSI